MLIPPTDLSISQYHYAAPRWLSKTSLRAFLDHGPKWWRLRYIDKVIHEEPSKGMIQGLALDTLLTDGIEEYMRRFVVRPADVDLRTREGKAWRAANEGKELLTAEDGLIIEEAAEAVCDCCLWSEIEDTAKAQQTIRYDEKSLGFGLQARPDWISIIGNSAIIYDLKKTRSLQSFGKQAIDLGYHLQAAVASYILQQHGIAVDRAYLIAVEWERGARCMVYEIPQYAIEHGRMQMIAAARGIHDLLAGKESNRQESPEELPIPEWMQRNMGTN